MPRFIVKLTDKDKDYYLHWSTIVNAPISYGMPLDEFKEYYKEKYGQDCLYDLERSLNQVEKRGVNSWEETPETLISGNRAGKDEKTLTMSQIIKHYCRERPPGETAC